LLLTSGMLQQANGHRGRRWSEADRFPNAAKEDLKRKQEGKEGTEERSGEGQSGASKMKERE
jgi:hypothetical protein